jgi:hypothetical protein
MHHWQLTIALLLSVAGSASAQLPGAVQDCIGAYDTKLRLVSLQAGKSARACVRNAAKGVEIAPDTCVVSNTDGKIAGKEAKVAALYTGGTCTGSEPIQQGAIAGNAAHRGMATDLAHDIFGDPVTAAVIGVGSSDARCLDMTLKRAVQSVAAITKGHRQCTKSGLNSGAVVDAATLDAACGSFAQIDGTGKAQARLTKLVVDVGAACNAATSGLATLFPGLDPGCHADGVALGGCVAERARCRACLALNDAGGQHIDCDLFDDDTADGSCVAFALGTQTCTLANTSRLSLYNSALPLELRLSGAVTISCGSTDAGLAAPCNCSIASFGALVVPAIGDLCISPAAGCPAGSIDCDGNPPRDRELAADHNIGTCTSNAGCAAQCDAHCAGLGAGFTRQAHGCEGFCQGGANDEMACTQVSECPGADCVGNVTVHGNICNCICARGGLGGASGAGDLDCSLGLQIDVELPSDGDCLDANVQSLPPRCVGITTTTTTGSIANTDNMTGFDFPSTGSPLGTRTGSAVSCDAMETGTLGGLTLVGQTALFDSALGDNFANLSISCQ